MQWRIRSSFKRFYSIHRSQKLHETEEGTNIEILYFRETLLEVGKMELRRVRAPSAATASARLRILFLSLSFPEIWC